MANKYDRLPKNGDGKKYILRSRCCVAPLFSTMLICGKCDQIIKEEDVLMFVEEIQPDVKQLKKKWIHYNNLKTKKP